MGCNDSPTKKRRHQWAVISLQADGSTGIGAGTIPLSFTYPLETVLRLDTALGEIAPAFFRPGLPDLRRPLAIRNRTDFPSACAQ